jgi:putative acetyltransferase
MIEISIEQLEPGNAEQKAAFAALNREWLEKYFRVEPVDEAIFADPERHILAGGGAILLARAEGKYVGVVALYAHEDGMFELAKMGVTEAYQGRGIGRRLGEEIIKLAKQRGLATLYITSNTVLKKAQRLYRSLGFVTSSIPLHSYYQRGNITLEKSLVLEKEAVA